MLFGPVAASQATMEYQKQPIQLGIGPSCGRRDRVVVRASERSCGMRSGMLVPLVVAQGFFELVFEGDDAAGGFEGGALVNQLSGSGG